MVGCLVDVSECVCVRERAIRKREPGCAPYLLHISDFLGAILSRAAVVVNLFKYETFLSLSLFIYNRVHFFGRGIEEGWVVSGWQATE